MRYKTILVDDEIYARKELLHQLEVFNCFDVVKQCENAVEGMKAIKEYSPDVVFLDIQMPGLSGFDMLSMLEKPDTPYIIFVTAYDEYAIRAFEESALDYLLKPIDPQRLLNTVKRIENRIGEDQSTEKYIKQLTKLPCSLNNVIKLVDVKDVCCVISDLTGVHLVTAKEKLLTDLTMKIIEQRTGLFRCHRQYLINLDMIKEIRLLDNGAAEAVASGDILVPVSRRSLKELKQHIGIR